MAESIPYVYDEKELERMLKQPFLPWHVAALAKSHLELWKRFEAHRMETFMKRSQG